MPKQERDVRLDTPSAIRITLFSSLTGVNMSLDHGGTASDPFGTSKTEFAFANLDQALNDLPRLVFEKIDEARDR